MAIKCKINARSALLPVPGTESDGKGTCPECLTPDRKLTGKGFVGAHNVVLDVDTTIPVTDEGARIGAPRDAAVRREIEGRKGGTPALRPPRRDKATGHYTHPVQDGAGTPVARTEDVAVAHRGPTLVRGRDTAPRLRDPELSWDEPTDLRQNGEVRKSTTFEQPLGRERFDRKITDVPAPKRKRTASERRRYRRAQRNAALTS